MGHSFRTFPGSFATPSYLFRRAYLERSIAPMEARGVYRMRALGVELAWRGPFPCGGPVLGSGCVHPPHAASEPLRALLEDPSLTTLLLVVLVRTPSPWGWTIS